MEYEYLFKIILVGNSEGGKTCLLSAFAERPFSSDTHRTIGVEFSIKDIIIQDRRRKIQIWDTAGQDRYKAITSAYYRAAVGAILVYDVSKRSSFDSLEL